MAINSFLKLFIFLFVEVNFLLARMLVSSIEFLALHEGFLLHLVNLQLINGNVGAPAFEFPPEEIILLFELVDDCSFEDLIGIFVFDFEVEVVVVECKFGLVLVQLFVEILHLFVG